MKKKSFDCVAMKNKIQAKLLEEYRGVPEEEVRLLRRQKLESDPSLARLWQKFQTPTNR